MKRVVDFIHTEHCDWLHFPNNLRSHSPDVKLSKNQCLLARHWWMPANQMHGHSHGWDGLVSQRRLTIYWEANERLVTSRATSAATGFDVWWMRANRAPTAMCHCQRFLALAMFEPARPCSTIAGTKLEDIVAGKRRRWCCSTNTKPNPALGG